MSILLTRRLLPLLYSQGQLAARSMRRAAFAGRYVSMSSASCSHACASTARILHSSLLNPQNPPRPFSSLNRKPNLLTCDDQISRLLSTLSIQPARAPKAVLSDCAQTCKNLFARANKILDQIEEQIEKKEKELVALYAWNYAVYSRTIIDKESFKIKPEPFFKKSTIKLLRKHSNASSLAAIPFKATALTTYKQIENSFKTTFDALKSLIEETHIFNIKSKLSVPSLEDLPIESLSALLSEMQNLLKEQASDLTPKEMNRVHAHNMKLQNRVEAYHNAIKNQRKAIDLVEQIAAERVYRVLSLTEEAPLSPRFERDVEPPAFSSATSDQSEPRQILEAGDN